MLSKPFLTSIHGAAQLSVFLKSSLADLGGREPLHRRRRYRTGRYTSIIQGALAKVWHVWWTVSWWQIRQTPILLATTLLTFQAGTVRIKILFFINYPRWYFCYKNRTLIRMSSFILVIWVFTVTLGILRQGLNLWVAVVRILQGKGEACCACLLAFTNFDRKSENQKDCQVPLSFY